VDIDKKRLEVYDYFYYLLGDYIDDREIKMHVANTILENLSSLGVVIADESAELPEIPEFQYDKEEYRSYLKRGAINYSKMLGNYRQVYSLKEE